MNINRILQKFFNKKEYSKYKDQKIKKEYINLYNEKIKKKLDEIKIVLKNNKEISFLHSGHLGDIVNSLPLIKEISKEKRCSLFLEKEKLLPINLQNSNKNSRKFYLTEESIEKMIPLLSKQNYLENVSIYNGEKVDINLNLFREMITNFHIDSVRWYFHITGIHGDLSRPYLVNIGSHELKDKIIIIRSKVRRNFLINYNFLRDYKDLLFLGLKDEYIDLKKEIPNLEFFECKDFLQMAQIINSSKLFIGNLSFGFTLAEALKKPRLLESGPNFPLVYPNGENAYDFYFQDHFEQNFKKLYKLK